MGGNLEIVLRRALRKQRKFESKSKSDYSHKKTHRTRIDNKNNQIQQTVAILKLFNIILQGRLYLIASWNRALITNMIYRYGDRFESSNYSGICVDSRGEWGTTYTDTVCKKQNRTRILTALEDFKGRSFDNSVSKISQMLIFSPVFRVHLIRGKFSLKSLGYNPTQSLNVYIACRIE